MPDAWAIEETAMALCPWQLTLPEGTTAHFTSEKAAEEYRDYLKERRNANQA